MPKHKKQYRKKKKTYQTKQRKVLPLLWWLLAGLFVLLGYFILSSPPARELIYTFKDQSDLAQWRFYNADTRISATGLILTNIRRQALLFNSNSELTGYTWHELPYVKLYLTPQDVDRTIVLHWLPEKKMNNPRTKIVSIPAHAEAVLVNTHQSVPWFGSFGWQLYGNGPINAFAVGTTTEIEIREIHLLPNLNVLEYIKLAAQEYWLTEPITVRSINAMRGLSILGQPLSYLLGLLLLLLFLPFLFRANSRTVSIFVMGGLICFIIYDITLNRTLFVTAQSVSQQSAWHTDKYQEYRSRFGDEFADLTRQFETAVPPGARVHFPQSSDRPISGETNWIQFQYQGLYRTIANAKNADYLFYYYPTQWQFDPVKKSVWKKQKDSRSRAGEKVVEHKVEEVVNLSKHLKVLRLIHE